MLPFLSLVCSKSLTLEQNAIAIPVRDFRAPVPMYPYSDYKQIQIIVSFTFVLLKLVLVAFSFSSSSTEFDLF
jgi:hypothetical protein